MDKIRMLELTNAALKESLAQKVADYEEKIALIRAEATILVEDSNLRIADLENQLSELQGDRNAPVEAKEDRTTSS